jgi:lambda family phage minor tail protein L
MTVRGDVQGLQPLTILDLFVFDATAITGNQDDLLHWHAGTTFQGEPVYWQGVRYEPMPIEAEGFEIPSTGKLPRPRLRGANLGGELGAYLRAIRDGLKAKVIRKRTLAKYLDAVNFPEGNPSADPNAHFPDEVYFVARKTSENPVFVEVELAAAFDVEGIMLPRRQVLASVCPWRYRSAECSYAGPPVQDVNGNPTNDPAKDQCRKTMAACRVRFGEYGELPYGAFPASVLVRG